MSLHLVLDTNIYRQSTRLDSADIKAVSFLARKKGMYIHVPYIVEREFSSHLEQEQRKKLASAAKSISSALNYDSKGALSRQLTELLAFLESNLSQLCDERTDAFERWMKDNNAIRHPLTLENTERALDAYFKGLPPFKEAKVRKDIPDSFIFQQISKLSEEHGNDLRIVAEDGALRGALKDLGVTCYKGLGDFLDDPNVSSLLKDKVIDDHWKEIAEVVKDQGIEKTPAILSALDDAILSSEYRELYSEEFPSENGYLTVVSIGDTTLSWSGTPQHIAGSLFSFPISGVLDITYEFILPNMSLFELDFDKYDVDQLNEHYWRVEGTDFFSFVGTVTMEYSEEILNSGDSDALIAALVDPHIAVQDLSDFEILP